MQSALAHLDSPAVVRRRGEAELERQMLRERFPLDSWSELPLERYALGHANSADSLCYLLEQKSLAIGSIRGGSSRKFLIYWRSSGGWWFDERRWNSVEEAWGEIRDGFVEAFALAQRGEWSEIDQIRAIRGAGATKLKLLHVYFPDEILPVFSADHLRRYLRALGHQDIIDSDPERIQLNRRLLAVLLEDPGLRERNTHDMAEFLYALDVLRPREPTILRVRPGRDNRWWSDCLAGGFICVGWDQLGDLDQYDDIEELREAHRIAYPDKRPTEIGRLASQLHTFRSLKPGDTVLANNGGSGILAVGEVVEPGYLYLAERAEARHAVAVDWDTSKSRKLDPPERWRLTIGKLSSGDLKRLLGPELGPSMLDDPEHYAALSSALARKRQAILYGPPGTGKTYIARRFAVRYLERQNKIDLTDLSDHRAFARAETGLTRKSDAQRLWWVTANPAQWSWDRLESDKCVGFGPGRLRRRYTELSVGDLVAGYESTPTKRIVALARVTAAADDEFTLEWVANVTGGPTYDDLRNDPVLGHSEPLRYRCRGILFALTEDESQTLADWLVEIDDSLAATLGAQVAKGAVGYLTRVTFHPSYGYEDFVERYRPLPANPDVGLAVKLRDGVFKRICDAAREDPDGNYLLLIDEINRANIPRVFGELITLLEKDKRGMILKLPSDREFQVPRNVVVVATMNTADRSIRLLDVALRRRFAFHELMPDSSVLGDATVEGARTADLMDALNMKLLKVADRERQLGHAMFMADGAPIADPDMFAEAFRHDILPTLQEYCFADFKDLERLIGPGLVDSEQERLKQETLEDTTLLIAALSDHLLPGADTSESE